MFFISEVSSNHSQKIERAIENLLTSLQQLAVMQLNFNCLKLKNCFLKVFENKPEH